MRLRCLVCGELFSKSSEISRGASGEGASGGDKFGTDLGKELEPTEPDGLGYRYFAFSFQLFEFGDGRAVVMNDPVGGDFFGTAQKRS